MHRAFDRCGADGIEVGVYFRRFHRGVLQQQCEVSDGSLFLFPCFHAQCGCEADGVGERCQAAVGVVLTQQDAVFRSRGKHAVGFIDTLHYEVVDEHADVRLVALQDELSCLWHVRCVLSCCESGIDSRHESLSCRLLIACGAVHLSCEEQSSAEFRFERVV